MKQLLAQHKSYVVVGMKDRAFLIDRSSTLPNRILELSNRDVDESNKEASTKNKQQEMQQDRIDYLNDITAVALISFDTSSPIDNSTVIPTLYCAVARNNKSLSIYSLLLSIMETTSTSPSSSSTTYRKFPSLFYHTPKRISCLTFASLPLHGIDGNNNKNDTNQVRTIPVLISGDLSGDSYAYNLLEKGSRLLLGHTASVLTGVTILQFPTECNDQMENQIYRAQFIATADRDEKIRISRFPESYIVEGYLLGHTKYVTAMDNATYDTTTNNTQLTSSMSILATCGGDEMIRLWDWISSRELCSIPTNDDARHEGEGSKIPSDIALNSNGTLVAVIFDDSKHLIVYKVTFQPEDSRFSMSLVTNKDCASQPLVLSFDESAKSDTLLVLTTEPQYFERFHIDQSGEKPTISSLNNEDDLSFVKALNTLAKIESIRMPNTIIEKDKHGNPVLQKEVETRGASSREPLPWRRPERIAIAKERLRENRRNRRAKKKQKYTEAASTEESD